MTNSIKDVLIAAEHRRVARKIKVAEAYLDGHPDAGTVNDWLIELRAQKAELDRAKVQS